MRAAATLRAYGVGLWRSSCCSSVVPVTMRARRDTRTPMWIAFASASTCRAEVLALRPHTSGLARFATGRRAWVTPSRWRSSDCCRCCRGRRSTRVISRRGGVRTPAARNPGQASYALASDPPTRDHPPARRAGRASPGEAGACGSIPPFCPPPSGISSPHRGRGADQPAGSNTSTGRSGISMTAAFTDRSLVVDRLECLRRRLDAAHDRSARSRPRRAGCGRRLRARSTRSADDTPE